MAILWCLKAALCGESIPKEGLQGQCRGMPSLGEIAWKPRRSSLKNCVTKPGVTGEEYQTQNSTHFRLKPNNSHKEEINEAQKHLAGLVDVDIF